MSRVSLLETDPKERPSSLSLAASEGAGPHGPSGLGLCPPDGEGKRLPFEASCGALLGRPGDPAVASRGADRPAGPRGAGLGRAGGRRGPSAGHGEEAPGQRRGRPSWGGTAGSRPWGGTHVCAQKAQRSQGQQGPQGRGFGPAHFEGQPVEGLERSGAVTGLTPDVGAPGPPWRHRSPRLSWSPEVQLWPWPRAHFDKTLWLLRPCTGWAVCWFTHCVCTVNSE